MTFASPSSAHYMSISGRKAPSIDLQFTLIRPSPSSRTVDTCTLTGGIQSTNSTAVPTGKPAYWRPQTQCTCDTTASSGSQASRAASLSVSMAATCRITATEAHFSFPAPAMTGTHITRAPMRCGSPTCCRS
ncbi:uncharacterized protein LOC142775388 [Rhipicephalus microplus]|uniref:uncharacterized protein LOC142775388 n=1 Tax=Rhipicephalus microplus TaxID=6941 RepID=UPI003F6D53E7